MSRCALSHMTIGSLLSWWSMQAKSAYAVAPMLYESYLYGSRGSRKGFWFSIL